MIHVEASRKYLDFSNYFFIDVSFNVHSQRWHGSTKGLSRPVHSHFHLLFNAFQICLRLQLLCNVDNQSIAQCIYFHSLNMPLVTSQLDVSEGMTIKINLQIRFQANNSTCI